MSLETHSFEFEEFLFDGKEKVFLCNGKPLSITPKAFQVPHLLVENHGHLVERNELLNIVWEDSFVEEGNLKFIVCAEAHASARALFVKSLHPC